MLTAEKLPTTSSVFVPVPSPEITVHVPGSDLTGPELLAWLGYPGDLPGDWPLLDARQVEAGRRQDLEGRRR